MNIIGIDPGMTGGFALLINDKLISVTVMPTTGKEVDCNQMYDWITTLIELYDIEIDMVLLEDVHAIFGAGAKATFNFGRNLGMIEGVLQTMRLPYKKVRPKAWQKVAWQGVPKMKKGTKNDTKGMSLVAVKRLFPKQVNLLLATERSRVPHGGIVDAILIAYSNK